MGQTGKVRACGPALMRSATVVAVIAGFAAAGAFGPLAAARTTTALRGRDRNPVAKYLKVRPHRTVILTLHAGMRQSVRGVRGFDFDGYAKGSLTVRIPTRWSVTVDCRDDGLIPHSCAIVKNAKAKHPVFRGAAVRDPKQGIAPHHAATFRFRTGRPGRYRIVCLVPGHEATGMWDRFTVTARGRPSISAR